VTGIRSVFLRKKISESLNPDFHQQKNKAEIHNNSTFLRGTKANKKRVKANNPAKSDNLPVSQL
jgi:hypothetical protein